jgi:hypothetical protein
LRWHIPRFDEVKEVTKFLWLPVTIGEETRWLEKATYQMTFRRDFGWIPCNWVSE